MVNFRWWQKKDKIFLSRKKAGLALLLTVSFMQALQSIDNKFFARLMAR